MNPTPEEIIKFTSNSDALCPAMSVLVTWPPWLAKALGRASFLYKVPPGFQLDRYVTSLHPSFGLQVEGCYESLKVSVFKDNTLIETHYGTYDDGKN